MDWQIEFTGDYATNCKLNQALGVSVRKSTLGIGRRNQILIEAMQTFDTMHPKPHQISPQMRKKNGQAQPSQENPDKDLV